MATKFCEFSAANDSADSLTVTLDAAVPVGSTLILGLVALGDTVPVSAVSITDTASNTWDSPIVGPLDLTGTGTTLTVVRCAVGTALSSGGSITIDATVTSGSVTRMGASIIGFDAEQDAGPTATFDNGGSNTPDYPVGPTASADGTVTVAAIAMANPGRTLTIDSPFTLGTKITTTGSSGNRAVCLAWDTSASSGPRSAEFHYNSSGSGVAAVIALPDHASPPTRTGQVKVWNGAAWVNVPARVDGDAYPVKFYDSDSGTWVLAR